MKAALSRTMSQKVNTVNESNRRAGRVIVKGSENNNKWTEKAKKKKLFCIDKQSCLTAEKLHVHLEPVFESITEYMIYWILHKFNIDSYIQSHKFTLVWSVTVKPYWWCLTEGYSKCPKWKRKYARFLRDLFRSPFHWVEDSVFIRIKGKWK